MERSDHRYLLGDEFVEVAEVKFNIQHVTAILLPHHDGPPRVSSYLRSSIMGTEVLN